MGLLVLLDVYTFIEMVKIRTKQTCPPQQCIEDPVCYIYVRSREEIVACTEVRKSLGS